MDNLEVKKNEWDQQAKASPDLGRQVCRTVDQTEFLKLIDDLKMKLQLTGKSGTVLDVGCGNAIVLDHLKGFFQQVHGTDFSANMVVQARSVIPQGVFSQGEANALNFKDGQFERVLSYSIFHYFPSVEYGYQTIDEMVRVCKKGGIVLIGDLLDKTQEKAIKEQSNLDYENQIPLIQRYSQWLFFDLSHIQKTFSAKGYKVEILDQPSFFKCSHYRKDVRIWV
jgi:ubiquinone/menaquinone biosynthesis C-methylase UbiE